MMGCLHSVLKVGPKRRARCTWSWFRLIVYLNLLLEGVTGLFVAETLGNLPECPG